MFNVTFRASCCSARLSRAQECSTVRDRSGVIAERLLLNKYLVAGRSLAEPFHVYVVLMYVDTLD